ncbi:NAD(P)H-dependent oxidoreductase [Solirubrobacter taibaiensis]|nr:NAD(P)H-dependent oxidoreductase [Solirubrobacter taibaiensis]
MSEHTSSDLQIMLVCGSVRRPSHTRALTAQIEQSLSRYAVVTTDWDLRERPLPIADPAHHDDPLLHPDQEVRDFVTAATLSDAFVLASPDYHNSFSGVLKNALDHLAIEQLQYKPVALAGHGGNRSSQAVDQLRIVVRGLHGVAIPAQVCTQVSDYRLLERDAYQVYAEDVLHRIERSAAELVVFAYQLRSARRPATTSRTADIG